MLSYLWFTVVEAEPGKQGLAWRALLSATQGSPLSVLPLVCDLGSKELTARQSVPVASLSRLSFSFFRSWVPLSWDFVLLLHWSVEEIIFCWFIRILAISIIFFGVSFPVRFCWNNFIWFLVIHFVWKLSLHWMRTWGENAFPGPGCEPGCCVGDLHDINDKKHSYLVGKSW